MAIKTCFLCGNEITELAWEFTEGLAHPECALSTCSQAAAEDFLEGLRVSDLPKEHTK